MLVNRLYPAFLKGFRGSLIQGIACATIALLAPIAINPATAIAPSLKLAQTNQAETAAKQLFQRYVQLRNNFDAEILQLYSPNAVVKVWIKHSNGAVQSSVLPFKQYRDLVLVSLASAKAKGDRSNFAKVVYQPEGNYIRISSQHSSQLSGLTTPPFASSSRDRSGQWMIFQEVTEVQR